MPQKHVYRHGTFHVTTATKDRQSTCTEQGIPKRLIEFLFETRDMQNAKLFAFCILPDHIHVLLMPGEKGLSAFMHAFKKNSSRAVPKLFWQKGYYDEKMKSEKQRSAALGYIQGNAAKHLLAADIESWPWSSLHYQEDIDPMEIWELS